MKPDDSLSFEQGKQLLLRAIEGAPDLTFVRGFGNIGDLLIHAGIRQLLAGLDYREVSILGLGEAQGHTAVFPGAGGFCHAHHKIPALFTQLESRFKRLVILPSSFDVTVPSVKSFLESTKSHVFARERESFRQIRGLCHADLSHDCAFYFRFDPYRRRGSGTLTAYRTDRESALARLPDGNNDISLTCETLDEFLWTIARHEMIRTDRAHVMIAAAMLGKRVEYWTSNYHKVPALAEFSLSNYPVSFAKPSEVASKRVSLSSNIPNSPQSTNLSSHNDWLEWIHLTALDIASVVPPTRRCILVDDVQLGELPVYNRLFLPFLEHDGQYWGNPSDDCHAVRELERMRTAGAEYIIFAWTARWWFNSYPEFIGYLHSRYRCKLENERISIFDLKTSR
jgi:hypothetical protein